MSGSKKDHVRPDNVLKTRQTSNKLPEILQMSRQSVIESRLGFFLSILHVMSKNDSLEKSNDLSSSRHNMDQLSYISIVSRSSFKEYLTQLSTSRSMHGVTTLSLKMLRHFGIHVTMICSCIIPSLCRISDIPSLLHHPWLRRCGVDLSTSVARWYRRSSILCDIVGADRKYTHDHYVSHIRIFASTDEKSQDNTHSIVRHCPWTESQSLYY